MLTLLAVGPRAVVVTDGLRNQAHRVAPVRSPLAVDQGFIIVARQ